MGIGRLWLAAALGSGLLTGCATVPGNMPALPFTGAAASTVMDPLAPLAPPQPRTWPDPAQDVLNQRARGFGLVHAPELQRYLNGLYSRIKTQAGVPTWPGGVQIVANEAMEAYATAAGNIYVSLPWLTSVESEDELVALLSHEFGHIYLHYHQLEGAIEGADMAAGAIGLGVALAKKTSQIAGWNQLDSLMAAYSLGKGLATTVYSRSQESAADSFGLNVSLKMRYSYEHGLKAFLERIASWEEGNREREVSRQEKLLAAIRADAIAKARKSAAGDKAPYAAQLRVAQATGEIQGAIGATLQGWGFHLEQAVGKMRSDHPDITQRIDTLARAVEATPAAQADADPIVAPLSAARKDKRTAAILANYELAFRALGAPGDPASLAAAKRAASEPTATHAVPLFALYTVLGQQPWAQPRRAGDPGQILEANFRSEHDRAWKLYTVRATGIKASSGAPAAHRILESGLTYFGKAEDAWPDTIRFYGETQGWDEAKRRAADCSKQFRRAAARCAAAAVSPAEQAESDRKAEAKAENLVDKWLKKK
ncbi:M48 family metalloprotease [Massilia sp. UMI-21]|nr:M48 family metalloprotease [Massilia sp. UMI-21]